MALDTALPKLTDEEEPGSNITRRQNIRLMGAVGFPQEEVRQFKRFDSNRRVPEGDREGLTLSMCEVDLARMEIAIGMFRPLKWVDCIKRAGKDKNSPLIREGLDKANRCILVWGDPRKPDWVWGANVFCRQGSNIVRHPAELVPWMERLVNARGTPAGNCVQFIPVWDIPFCECPVPVNGHMAVDKLPAEFTEKQFVKCWSHEYWVNKLGMPPIRLVNMPDSSDVYNIGGGSLAKGFPWVVYRQTRQTGRILKPPRDQRRAAPFTPSALRSADQCILWEDSKIHDVCSGYKLALQGIGRSASVSHLDPITNQALMRMLDGFAYGVAPGVFEMAARLNEEAAKLPPSQRPLLLGKVRQFWNLGAFQLGSMACSLVPHVEGHVSSRDDKRMRGFFGEDFYRLRALGPRYQFQSQSGDEIQSVSGLSWDRAAALAEYEPSSSESSMGSVSSAGVARVTSTGDVVPPPPPHVSTGNATPPVQRSAQPLFSSPVRVTKKVAIIEPPASKGPVTNTGTSIFSASTSTVTAITAFRGQDVSEEEQEARRRALADLQRGPQPGATISRPPESPGLPPPPPPPPAGGASTDGVPSPKEDDEYSLGSVGGDGEESLDLTLTDEVGPTNPNSRCSTPRLVPRSPSRPVSPPPDGGFSMPTEDDFLGPYVVPAGPAPGVGGEPKTRPASELSPEVQPQRKRQRHDSSQGASTGGGSTTVTVTQTPGVGNVVSIVQPTSPQQMQTSVTMSEAVSTSGGMTTTTVISTPAPTTGVPSSGTTPTSGAAPTAHATDILAQAAMLNGLDMETVRQTPGLQGYLENVCAMPSEKDMDFDLDIPQHESFLKELDDVFPSQPQNDLLDRFDSEIQAAHPFGVTMSPPTREDSRNVILSQPAPPETSGLDIGERLRSMAHGSSSQSPGDSAHFRTPTAPAIRSVVIPVGSHQSGQGRPPLPSHVRECRTEGVIKAFSRPGGMGVSEGRFYVPEEKPTRAPSRPEDYRSMYPYIWDEQGTRIDAVPGHSWYWMYLATREVALVEFPSDQAEKGPLVQAWPDASDVKECGYLSKVTLEADREASRTLHSDTDSRSPTFGWWWVESGARGAYHYPRLFRWYKKGGLPSHTGTRRRPVQVWQAPDTSTRMATARSREGVATDQGLQLPTVPKPPAKREQRERKPPVVQAGHLSLSWPQESRRAPFLYEVRELPPAGRLVRPKDNPDPLGRRLMRTFDLGQRLDILVSVWDTELTVHKDDRDRAKTLVKQDWLQCLEFKECSFLGAARHHSDVAQLSELFGEMTMKGGRGNILSTRRSGHGRDAWPVSGSVSGSTLLKVFTPRPGPSTTLNLACGRIRALKVMKLLEHKPNPGWPNVLELLVCNRKAWGRAIMSSPADLKTGFMHNALTFEGELTPLTSPSLQNPNISFEFLQGNQFGLRRVTDLKAARLTPGTQEVFIKTVRCIEALPREYDSLEFIWYAGDKGAYDFLTNVGLQTLESGIPLSDATLIPEEWKRDPKGSCNWRSKWCLICNMWLGDRTCIFAFHLLWAHFRTLAACPKCGIILRSGTDLKEHVPKAGSQTGWECEKVLNPPPAPSPQTHYDSDESTASDISSVSAASSGSMTSGRRKKQPKSKRKAVAEKTPEAGGRPKEVWRHYTCAIHASTLWSCQADDRIHDEYREDYIPRSGR